mgnify:CR=1 FL=1
MKVLVIGNCQARPIASILEKISPDVETLEPIILHLSDENDEEAHLNVIESADLIFTQYTVDAFKPAHLRSSRLKETRPEKTFVWPNIFYAGQQPDLCYITHVGTGRIKSPLDTYHDLDILSDWYALQDVPFPFEKTSHDVIHQQSLTKLRDREVEACDVIVSDLIEEKYKSERLFFTFNHPSLSLLKAVASRLIEVSGLSFKRSSKLMPEPLGRFVPRSIWDTDKLHQRVFSGSKIDLADPNIALPGPPVKYSYKELVSLSHKCYEVQKSRLLDMEKLRFTPNYIMVQR